MITATCPNCNTQYQLTQEQLNVAGGKVRCGACMTVFQAEPEEMVPQLEQEALIDDNFQLDDSEAEQEPSQMRKTETGSFYLFDEENLSDSFKNIDTSKQYLGDEVIPNEEAESNDESWAEQLLREDEEEEKKQEQELERKRVVEEEAAKQAAKEQARIEETIHANDFDDIGFDTDDKQGLLSRIQPEPLELKIAGNGGLWLKLAWFLLLLMLGGVLFAQLLFFQFDSWAKQSTWRPVYGALCQHLDCELPNLYNIDDISAQHLSVNSHKVYKNTLVVDAVLNNQSNIAQPFPYLELFFTDTENQVVAARRFAPAEYLHGELKGKTMMPAKQPIRIALEIVDPGKQASGYYLQLRE